MQEYNAGMSLDLQRRNGFWSWYECSENAGLCFAGKAVGGSRQADHAEFQDLHPENLELAWLRQTHSTSVVDAGPGDNGSGDALTTEQPDLALAVVTADCVPVLLSAGTRIAAVHAGWRGLAGRIIPAAVQQMWRLSPHHGSEETTAWIGPAIGPCCYEVGEDVAAQVRAASAPEFVKEGPRGRPHLDLPAVARWQLQQIGVDDVRLLGICTRCDERLWSYRRDGAQAGRNAAVIWRAAIRDAPAETHEARALEPAADHTRR